MKIKLKSIRPFIGAKDFKLSRQFYKDLGFEEIILEQNLSVFKKENTAFYLQNYDVKEWLENTMLFVEVENTEEFYNEILSLKLHEKYENVKLIPIKINEWGKECFLIDPSGILWHFGEFF